MKAPESAAGEVGMRGWARAFAWVSVPLVAAALSGCSVVDDFSGRAVDFNLQAEQVQEQSLLLNIVRASLRRPMQFTGLQSITGTASISGGSTLSAPFGEAMHRPKGAVSPDVFGLSGTISGGPSFVVPVLDTQEFYEGILAPISLQVFDYYLQQGFPKEVLFDLFVSKVVVTQRADGNCVETPFNNSVNDDAEFDQFQAIVDMLFAAGLSTEHVETASTVGPPISAKSLTPSGNGDVGAQAAALIRAYADAANAGLKFTKGQGAQKDTYRLEKNATTYRFCFADPGPTARSLLGNIDPTLFCGHSRDRADAGADEARPPGGGCLIAASQSGAGAANASNPEGTAPGSPDAGGSATLSFSFNQKLVQTLDQRLNTAASGPMGAEYAQHVSAEQILPGAVSVTMQIRSTEGILYYLGEVTRRHLYPDASLDGRPRVIQVPTRVPGGAMPRTACADPANSGKPVEKTDVVYLNGAEGGSPKDAYYCENLFVVDQPLLIGGFVNVDYDGHRYELADDKDRGGRTYQVLELAKQLFSLNISAKSLPASSTIVISQP
jgi:hypothetical protein